ncbi:TetR/AcrR family transcriptional regulator [Candidatus Aerophobetes bacterium]|nr:TetR/AcrR family transcriptional regulator [Candidatus Aerophobetes bacterium]
MPKVQTLKEKKKADHKDKILKAGEKLFASKGFHLTTLEEIARKAKLAKGTIYLHFANKKDLFVSVIERKLDILLEKIRKGAEQEDLPVAKIKKITRVHLEFLEKNRSFFQILQSLSPDFKKEMEKELAERVIKKNALYLDLLQKLIQQAIKEKQIKPLNPRKLAVILVGIIHSLTINWISEGEKESLSKDHEIAWEVFWSGVKI